MVTAGQVYRAQARKGTRLVKIIQVRGLSSGNPYALAREVYPTGALAQGWLHGVQRNLPIRIALRWLEGRPAMPVAYTLTEGEKP